MIRSLTWLAMVCALGGVLGAAGCSAPASKPPGPDYAAQGGAAEVRGDWDDARRAFGQAVLVADQSGWPASQRAAVHFDYGRALGVTCYYAEAERELSQAYDLDILTGRYRYPALVELARLALVQRQFDVSAKYFGRALGTLDRLEAARKVPYAYAELLDDYALALGGAGDAQAATRIIDRAAKVRADFPDQTRAQTTSRTPYGSHCGQLSAGAR
ncbi:tetratricopeptide repeat protein [Pandoraea sp. NPDC087047]|uniref:tetratricopeptide repeat protein n=1 Tax=Pandoraea sp. NPDC087047 TaxID=3364390 RepID=UPI003808C6F1